MIWLALALAIVAIVLNSALVWKAELLERRIRTLERHYGIRR